MMTVAMFLLGCTLGASAVALATSRKVRALMERRYARGFRWGKECAAYDARTLTCKPCHNRLRAAGWYPRDRDATG